MLKILLNSFLCSAEALCGHRFLIVVWTHPAINRQLCHSWLWWSKMCKNNILDLQFKSNKLPKMTVSVLKLFHPTCCHLCIYCVSFPLFVVCSSSSGTRCFMFRVSTCLLLGPRFSLHTVCQCRPWHYWFCWHVSYTTMQVNVSPYLLL